jgi:prepilin-type N-terminal cleavage/methylation domain-containing protein
MYPPRRASFMAFMVKRRVVLGVSAPLWLRSCSALRVLRGELRAFLPGCPCVIIYEGGQAMRTGASRTVRRGFTLVELMVTIVIIAALISLVSVGIVAVLRYLERSRARLSMQGMSAGLVSLKKDYELGTGLPLGVYTNGRTARGTTEFTDEDRDFSAEGVGVGAEILIISTPNFRRKVTGHDSNVLTLDGPPFAESGRELAYFVIKPGGERHPRIQPVRELDPKGKAWASSFTPHLNSRKTKYFEYRAERVQNGFFRDPWGRPYVYELTLGQGVVIERFYTAGRDGKPGTGDDLEQVASTVPFKP